MMIQLDTYEYDINTKFTIAEFRQQIDLMESRGATHVQLSYQDYGNPLINLFEEVEQEEKDVPVLFHTIKNKIGWSEWCDVVGGNHYAINEGYSPNDSDVFYCTPSQAMKLGI